MMATASPVLPSFQTPPVAASRSRIPGGTGSGSFPDQGGGVQVRVTGVDKQGSSSDSLNLDLNLPSPTNYKAPTGKFTSYINQ